MQIDVKTDPDIAGRETVARVVEVEVERALEPFGPSLTHVAVRLDESTGGGGQKRCTIEARSDGRPPVKVSERAPGVGAAVAAAVRRLASELERTGSRRRRG